MKILIAEDDLVALALLQGILEENGHEVVAVTDGQQAMEKLYSQELNVVISDWEMPQMNGLELCRAVRGEELGRYVFIILLTSRQGTRDLVEGLAAGADEFMSKPLIPEELEVRLRTAERILALESRNLAIFAMAKLAESRDPETGVHLDRVRQYVRFLATNLSQQPKFEKIITPAFISLLYQTSPLHDIGKISIPDHVLLKPGRLDDQEFAIMKMHTRAGAETLDQAAKQYPDAGFLRMARDIALSHHERYDGKGYPEGIAGETIPLAARIFSVADVYDALVSKRVYKAAFSHAVAKNIVLQGEGTQFDPDVIQAFIRCEEKFHAMAQALTDEPLESTAAK